MTEHNPPFGPFSAPDADFDLGSTPNLYPETQSGHGIDLTTAFHLVAQSVKGDPAMMHRLISMIGTDIVATAKARRVPKRMPVADIRAVECSIAYSPPRSRDKSKNGKSARARPDREKLSYYVTIQVFGSKSQGLADPLWSGAAQLRSPDRAAKDARSKQRKTSLSDECADWIDSVIIPVARQNDLLIGFLMDKRAGEGTYYHDYQFILIDRQELEARKLNSAILLSTDKVDDNLITTKILIPKFSDKTSGGKALSGTFILQSRGITKYGDRKGWATGIIQKK